MFNLPRIPLHIQHPALAKAQKVNPSWESFREHQIHEPQYKLQGEDRPSTHAMSMIRRNPDGTLDYQWAKNTVIDAIHNMAYPHALRPVDLALITVLIPGKFVGMEAAQAEILTQFSNSEKAIVKQIVEAQLKEEENYNAGRGGGSIPGRSQTKSGTP